MHYLIKCWIKFATILIRILASLFQTETIFSCNVFAQFCYVDVRNIQNYREF